SSVVELLLLPPNNLLTIFAIIRPHVFKNTVILITLILKMLPEWIAYTGP
ncbi:MAG: hypothetical protein PWQ63_687, partial [Methanolobus sp.]|nr:hypothetical protein [Methanolobus sp.]